MTKEIDVARTTPEAQGIPSTAVIDFIDGIEAAGIELHSFMLVRHGSAVAEGWWRPYAPQRRHMLFSLSKSFTSTAAGLATLEGLLTLDDTVVSYFPNDLPAEISENLAKMRVRDLLAMATGHADDSLPYLFRDNNTNWARAFLLKPVDFEPGTHFVYNSGATYMVSAILHKVTGIPLIDYLRPRLFEPLGIVDPWWETCPMGINVGGWGLNIRTEDIARFGRLYLQKGRWGDRQIMPEAWVDLATSKQIDNGDDPNNDWNQGYAFQFWRCRHNAYRADGAFGQFCVVMPDQDAVLAATAGTGDLQGVLNQLWTHLLPAMAASPRTPDAEGHRRLQERLTDLHLPTVSGTASSPMAAKVSGRTYRFEPNEDGWKSMSMAFSDDSTEVTIATDHGEYSVTGVGANRRNSPLEEGAGEVETVTNLGIGARPSPSDGRAKGEYPCAVSGAWSDFTTYTLKVRAYESPFAITLTAAFDGETVTLERQANVAFSPTERPRLVGRLESAT